MNLAYVYLAHVSSWSGAPLVGFTAATMTLSKTILYWAQEFYCGGCAVGHNAWGDLLLYYVIPNGCVFGSVLGLCVASADADCRPFSDLSSRVPTSV